MANANHIDTKTAAQLLGVTPRWLQQLQKDGWVQSVTRGKWDLVNVVQGYIAFLKDENSRSSKAAAASRTTDARTREIEQRIAMRDGTLIAQAEHDAILDEVTGKFLSSLASLPTQITRQKRERDRIETIVDQERERVSAYFEKRRDELRSRRLPDETSGEADT